MMHVVTKFGIGALTSAISLSLAGVALAQAPAPVPVAPAPAPLPVAAPAAQTNPDIGDPGVFIIDQVSGFRGRVGGGVQYYGPIGFAYNSFSSPGNAQIVTNGTGQIVGVNQTETTIKSYSIWLAPSLDYFVAPNISVGGLFSVDTQWGTATSKTTNLAGGASASNNSVDLPTVTSVTVMPRVGYFIRINDRLSFWPRLGFGYFHGSNAYVNTSTNPATKELTTTTTTTSVGAILVQLDVGLIYQITDNVFFRIAPAITFSTSGTGTVKYSDNTADQSGDGSAFSFEVNSGFGANFSL